jgi:hypothetical protein
MCKLSAYSVFAPVGCERRMRKRSSCIPWRTCCGVSAKALETPGEKKRPEGLKHLRFEALLPGFAARAFPKARPTNMPVKIDDGPRHFCGQNSHQMVASEREPAQQVSAALNRRRGKLGQWLETVMLRSIVTGNNFRTVEDFPLTTARCMPASGASRYDTMARSQAEPRHPPLLLSGSTVLSCRTHPFEQ